MGIRNPKPRYVSFSPIVSPFTLHTDLGPNFHHEMHPGAIVLHPLSQNPRDNFTDACLKALLDRGIMAFSDRRTNSVLIPTSSTVFSERLLQIIEDEADKSPLKHFIPASLTTVSMLN